MKKNKNYFCFKLGFTLVELIVVITILAILGTVAFISLQGYSENARDSTRISDISSMKSSLELYQLDAGKYPLPTQGVNITYSGAIVWNQGTFGETVFANVEKLNKIPTDPLTDKEYTYSVISTRNEYEISGVMEGDTISYGPPLTPPYQGGGLATEAYAGTTEATAYVTGNYNGVITKTLNGNACKILSLPTILTNDTSITDLQDIITQKRFVYNGFKNLASSFKGSRFKEDGGFDFQPAQLIAYSDTGSCANLTANTTEGQNARVTLLDGLKKSYSGTLVQNEGEIKNIVDLVIDTNSPSNEVVNYAGNFVNNSLGGKVIVNNNSTSSNAGCITDTQLTLINNAWKSYDIDIFSDVDRNNNINADDFATGYTINQWCNDVKVININSDIALTTDLVNTYNSITNLYSVNFTGDVSANSILLGNLNNYFYRGPNRFCTSIPTEVWTFTNIKGIISPGCGVQIPTTIGNLTNLEYLDVSGNDLSLITTELGNLTKLKLLKINNTGINSFPTGVDNIISLTDLNISGNSISIIPTTIGNLTNLVNLELNTLPSVTSIPSTIGNLTKLNILSIDETGISTLPTSIGNLINMQSLMIDYNNSLTSIPSEIGNLVNMDTLNITNNPNLTTIPSSIGSLTNLQYLYLSDNNLNTLPSELSNLNNLINLGLDGNTGLGNLNNSFDETSSALTQGGMTIQGNGTNIVVSGTFN
ncbi:MAG: type II secretion system protein GspG [Candidatus Gracilibacteria bacterium]|nr:type II secretion system protein GspG [Candidatus Gracilibacteria bacterium]